MTDIQPAARELAALAQAMRGWDEGELMGAMLAARNAGWDFEQTFREVARLLLLRDGDPAALRHAAAHPLRPVTAPGPGPDTYEQGAALARELLEHRDDDTGSAA